MKRVLLSMTLISFISVATFAQGARFGVPGRGGPGRDPALADAAAEPALHGGDPRAEAGGAGGAAEGDGGRGQGAAGATTLVEAPGVAGAGCG